MAIYKNSFRFTSNLEDKVFDEAKEYLSKIDLIKDNNIVNMEHTDAIDLSKKLESITFDAEGALLSCGDDMGIWFGIINVTSSEDLSNSEVNLLDDFVEYQIDNGFGKEFESKFNSKIDINFNGNVFDKYPTEKELDNAAEILSHYCLYTDCRENPEKKCKFYRQAINDGYELNTESGDMCPGILSLVDYYSTAL